VPIPIITLALFYLHDVFQYVIRISMKLQFEISNETLKCLFRSSYVTKDNLWTL